MEIEVNGLRVVVEPDEDAQSPRREMDNVGHMVCFYKRHDLGDEHDLKSKDHSGWDQMEEHLRKELGAVIILPLYLYDHSGITISTTPFSCAWDSGQVGFIYATKDDVKKNFMSKRVTQKMLNKTKEILESEVKIYDAYLTGDVWQYSIHDGDQMLDSCSGLYEFDYCKQEAENAARRLAGALA